MLKDVKAFLIDLDGTLYIDNDVVPGAPEAINQLRRKGYLFRFVTNTTNKSRATIKKKIEGFHIQVSESEIFSAALAAAQLLRSIPEARCWILTRGDSIQEFSHLSLTDQEPNFIVLGDLAHEFSFDLLNQVFRKLLAGAELVALQKNRYWLTGGVLTLDAGPFITALEYATGKPARLVGKPSRNFFDLAVADLGLPAGRVAMVGDDIEADVAGALNAGLRAVLVKTGKFREQDVLGSEISPHEVIESIAELPRVV